MGREKFNNLSTTKKQIISNEINAKINEITKLKKSYKENLDIFDAVNDEMKSLLECDSDCSTCDTNDIGKCLQNFRLANIFLQRQCRQLVHIIDNYLDTFSIILEGAGIIISGLKIENKEKKGDTHYYS